MLKRYHSVLNGIFKFTDPVIIGISWLLSYWFRFQTLYPIPKGIPALENYVALCPFIVLLWTAVFSGLGVYTKQRLFHPIDEIAPLIKAHSTALALFLTLGYLSTEYRYSRGVIISFSVISGISLILSRIFIRKITFHLRSQHTHCQKVLGIGEGAGMEKFFRTLQLYPQLGLNFIGTLVKNLSPSNWKSSIPLMGNWEKLSESIQELRPDIILISLPKNQETDLEMLLQQLNKEVVAIQLIPSIYPYIALGCAVEDFNHLPLIHLNDTPLQGWSELGKRAVDFFLSVLILILLAPFLFIIALSVKLSSPGPILYFQERMGLDGQLFQMLKFRTMTHQAEATTGAVWSTPNDDRKTWIGRFLRKTSLDELPQLWNVLLGEMSLVGPRPERPVFVEKFKDQIPHYMLRHKVKAGMTGWAQIHGWRGASSLEQRIEYDLYYVRNWSYSLDFKILILTLWKGFIHPNAY